MQEAGVAAVLHRLMEDVYCIVCVREGRGGGGGGGGRGGQGGGNYEEKGGQEEHTKYIPMLSCTSHLLFLLLGACRPR